MELKQTLKIQQQLIMTPQLKNAIKLLQITRPELIELIYEELKTNPLLEEEAHTEETLEVMEKPEKLERENNTKENVNELLKSIRNADDYSAEDLAEEQIYGDEDKSFESKKEDSLYEKLIWQLELENFNEEEKLIGRIIIGNIDDDGYIRISTEEIAKQLNLPVEKINRVLGRIQEFDPPGIGARNLKECLLIQVKQQNIVDPLITELIENWLEEIEQKRYEKLMKKLDIDENRLKSALKIIRSFNPKPGLSMSTTQTIPIVPDVIVKKVGDDYIVMLNNAGIPRIRFNSYYYNLLINKSLNPDISNYLNEKFRSAKQLIQSIQKRNQNILAVAKSIVKYQREFLDKGFEYLKPLVLRDVADDAKISESTVSRICNGKYMETHLGIFEMKAFFSPRVRVSENGDMAGDLIKRKIKFIIDNEDPKNPLTDIEITRKLEELGIKIARRTVVKYREQMQIPPAGKRRTLFK